MDNSFLSINGNNVQTLQILLTTTLITLLPSLLVMLTSFTRYIIALSFLRSALGTQQTPPNVVLIGIALFLTLFTMAPTLTQISAEAYEPYKAGQINETEFVDRAKVPLKHFMLRQTEVSSLNMFCELSSQEIPADSQAAVELPMTTIVPAFMASELKKAFEIGFFLYIPFMLIDIIVSSTLMSMGMIMLPPSMISMPFKLLLFVSTNGWQLLFSTLVKGFR